jgi:tetratricopeptide (TPR) repeat protein
MQGEWRELLLMGFELSSEPLESNPHSAQVTVWLQEATRALRTGNFKKGEALLRQALAEEPDAPDLLNNLAAAYSMQEREQDSEALIRDIHERHPDYFFGRTNLARILIQHGEYERARQLLDPLLQLKRMHLTEFDNLCAAEISLLLAEGNGDAVRSWLGLWESSGSDSPMLAQFRRQVGRSKPKSASSADKPNWLKRLLG